jgi:hypothetical protein
MASIAPVHLTCAVLLALPMVGRAAQDDAAAEAARVFESLYAADVQRVRATPDPSDNIDLAKRILTAADQATNQPALLAVLLRRAADLAAVHPDGHETAIRALTRLTKEVSEQSDAAAEQIVEIRQKQFNAARRADRPKAADLLVDALLASARHAEKAGDLSGAQALLRRAQGVGRTVRSKRVSEIDARLSRILHAAETAASIELLKEQVAKDPKRQQTRAKLVRLLLVDTDNPAEAAKYLRGLQEESLRKYVPLAAKGPEAADEPHCMELGDWYRSLGETAADHAKPAMFARARAYYERFLALHTAQDLKRTAATLALKKVEVELARLGPAATTLASGPATIKPGEWVDLMPMIDLERHVVGGTWTKRDGRLVVAPDGPDMRTVQLPVRPEGNYEYEMRFMNVPGLKEIFTQQFIRGGYGLHTCLYTPKPSLGLEEIDGKGWPKSPTKVNLPALATGQEYTLTTRVLHLPNDAVGITVALNGRTVNEWTGAAARLKKGRESLGIGTWKSAGVITGLRLRMLSGEAKVLTAGQTAGAAKATSPAEPTPTVKRKTVVKAGESAELLPRVDCTNDVKAGLWRTDGDELLLEDGYWGHIQLPAAPQGSYELQVVFTRTVGSQDIPVHLPVGGSRVMLNMNRSDSAGLGLINGKDAHENKSSVHYGKRLTNNARHTLTVKVLVNGDLAAIDARLDGPDKRRVQWQGPWSALSVGSKHAIIDRRLLGLAAHRAKIRYHAVRLKMLSGEARLLR